MGATEADDAIAFSTTREEILDLCRKLIDHQKLIKGIHDQFGIDDEPMRTATEIALGQKLVRQCKELARMYGRGTVCDVCTKMAEHDRFYPFVGKALRDAVKAVSY